MIGVPSSFRLDTSRSTSPLLSGSLRVAPATVTGREASGWQVRGDSIRIDWTTGFVDLDLVLTRVGDTLRGHANSAGDTFPQPTRTADAWAWPFPCGDTLDLGGVFRMSLVRILRDAEQHTSRVANARTIYVDVASFRKAADLGDDVPDDWKDAISLAGPHGVVKRSVDVWHCDPKQDKRACEPPADGELLVFVNAVEETADGLQVQIGIEWGYPRGPGRTGGGYQYKVTFRPAGAGARFIFDTVQLWLIS